MTALSFSIPGQPVPYQRVASSGRQRFTAPRSRAYMRSVGLHTVQAVARAKRAGITWPTDARYAVTLVVVNGDRRARDLDNVAKNLDGATGVLWADDSQIWCLRVIRAEPDKARPRLVVHVAAVSADWLALTAQPFLAPVGSGVV